VYVNRLWYQEVVPNAENAPAFQEYYVLVMGPEPLAKTDPSFMLVQELAYWGQGE